jgi:hypothetical protein
MTRDEHALLVCMFTRMHAVVGAIAETLKRENLWSVDDQKAYEYAIRTDAQQMGKFFFQTMGDYLQCANKMEVTTGLEPPNISP